MIVQVLLSDEDRASLEFLRKVWFMAEKASADSNTSGKGDTIGTITAAAMEAGRVAPMLPDLVPGLYSMAGMFAQQVQF